MTENFELSIVMPCLNEAETLARCIRKASGFLQKSGIQGEIVIGDNGSTDGSQKIARELGARVVHVPVRGYGAACTYASLDARGKYVIMGDSDDSYDFGELMPFVHKLREGYDLVMGNRFKGGIEPGAMPTKNRYLGNPVLTTIGKVFFKSPVGDFHCGLRGYAKEAFKRMDLQTTGMEFATEMVIKAQLMGLKVAEVPTTLSKDGRSRPPHLRPWRDGWRHLRLMLLYSPRWLFLVPGICLMLAGLVLGGAILAGWARFGAVTLDVHSLVYAGVAIELGFQSVFFAVFSKIFAIREGLLPHDSQLEKFTEWFTLEKGVAVGVLLTLLGIAGATYGVWVWEQAGFGALEPREMLKVVVPSGVFIAMGAQLIFSSFFLGMLRIDFKRLK